MAGVDGRSGCQMAMSDGRLSRASNSALVDRFRLVPNPPLHLRPLTGLTTTFTSFA